MSLTTEILETAHELRSLYDRHYNGVMLSDPIDPYLALNSLELVSDLADKLVKLADSTERLWSLVCSNQSLQSDMTAITSVLAQLKPSQQHPQSMIEESPDDDRGSTMRGL